jgi:hypothetical protein
MGLFKRAHVRGINHELVRQGLIGWPNEKIAEMAADEVADSYDAPPEEEGAEEELPPEEEGMPPEGMPEEGIPEVTGDEGLTPEQAAGVIEQLVEVAENIAAKTGGARDMEFPKLAAAVDYADAAEAHATALIIKAAEEADGTDVTGDGRFQEDTTAGGMADIDARDNPSSEVTGPQGHSDVDTSVGEVGAQVPQEPPGASAETPAEVAKLSAALVQYLQKKSDSNPGSGDTGSTGHEEPPDNQDMSGVAPAQGSTTQPKGPLMGEQKPQERENSPSTPGEVAKLSSLLTRVFAKLSEEEEKKDEEEKKEEEPAKEEEAKEASLRKAIETLASYVGKK